MTDAKLLEGFEERSAEVKGRRLRWFVAGPEDGPPLVLVHGLGGAAVNWSLLAPRLAGTRRVLAVDLPGHGGSEPLPAAPSLAPYADRVARAAAAEGFERAVSSWSSVLPLISFIARKGRPSGRVPSS